MKTYTAKELSSPANTAILDEIVLLISHTFTEDQQTRWLFTGHSRESYIACLPIYIRALINLALLSDATVTAVTKDEVQTSTSRSSRASNEDTSKPQIILPPNATIRAVGVTIPPHGNAIFDSAIAPIRAGLMALPFKVGFGVVWKLFTQFLPQMHRMHDDMFPPTTQQASDNGLPVRSKYDNFHLFYLAAHPENQGQGLGKKILHAIQQDVRQFNQMNNTTQSPYPLYLEASSVNNKRLYNRVGFQDRTSMVMGDLGGEEYLNVKEDGSVIGVKMFGMVWDPRQEGA